MTPLESIIRDIIAAQGALSLAAYMELALQHPQHGYYRVRKPIGRDGDFITAPEISQMFGEMIGVWCAEVWRQLGKPEPFALVELGPGRGTMMQDILRATAHVGGFHAAKQLYLIDSDRALRGDQTAQLGDYGPRYVDELSQLPAMPVVILANEFFDALPVRQFVKTFRGWAEHMVMLADGGLAFGKREIEDSERALIPAALRAALPETIVEISPRAQNIMRDIAREMKARSGAMLVVDYGYSVPSGAATVQAVSHHAHANIFDRPGEIDLTAHVDFAALAAAAHEGGAAVSSVIGQGEFLRTLGIDIRADALKKKATLPQIAAIDAALHRLTDEDQMGVLFKVMEVRG